MGRLKGMGLAVVLTALLLGAARAEPVRTRAVRSDVQLVVQVAASGLSGLVAKAGSRAEKIALIRDFVAGARFFPSREGYFFVYDTEGVCVAHGVQPDLIGRDLIDLKDKAGFEVVRAIVERGRAGGGYIEYHWSKPGKPGTFEKLGYVEPIEGTDFIIGSGLYYMDIW